MPTVFIAQALECLSFHLLLDRARTRPDSQQLKSDPVARTAAFNIDSIWLHAKWFLLSYYETKSLFIAFWFICKRFSIMLTLHPFIPSGPHAINLSTSAYSIGTLGASLPSHLIQVHLFLHSRPCKCVQMYKYTGIWPARWEHSHRSVPLYSGL